MGEIRKLEQLLEQSDDEKVKLNDSLVDSKTALTKAISDLDSARKEILIYKEKISQMNIHINTMDTVSSLENNEESEVSSDEHPEMLNLKNSLKQSEHRYESSLKQISELQAKVESLSSKLVNYEERECKDDLKLELQELQNKVASYEENVKNLEMDLFTMTQNSNEARDSLNSTQDELVKVTEDLAQFYHYVCEVNGETPNRVMLEHAQGRRFKR